MKSKWKAWIPNHNVERNYYICKLIDDENGLHVFLVSIDYKKKVCIQFPGMVYAYRNSLELAALRTLDEIVDETGTFMASNWTFFVMDESTYAKEVSEQSQEIYSFSQLIHFAIVAGNTLLEVITDALPTITDEWDSPSINIE